MASGGTLPLPKKTDANYKDKLSHLCKLAEASDRHDDMCHYIKLLIEAHGQAPELKDKRLSVNDRNLFSVGFKSVIGKLRHSWRQVDGSLEEQENVEMKKKYKAIIQGQIDALCKEVIEIVTDHILPHERDYKQKVEKEEDDNRDANLLNSAEALVFYNKMIADYHRYSAELRPGEEEVGDLANQAYQAATQCAEPLGDTHPTKLGLALNHSVCLYEIVKKKKDAIRVAKDAFDLALKKLDKLDDKDYKDSTLIMQLLRDNLTLWTQDADPQKDGVET